MAASDLERVIMVAFPCLFVPFGLIQLASVGRWIWVSRRSQQWLSAQGKVIAHVMLGLPYLDRQRGGYRTHPMYLPRYEYEVDGRTYVGERVRMTEFAEAPALNGRVRKRYRVGRRVTVWYDPRDPRQSLLEREVPLRQVRRDLLLGTFVLSVGCFFAWLGWNLGA